MRTRCPNCRVPVVGEVDPTYCPKCVRAIGLVVDVVASRLVAVVLADLAAEAAAAVPAVQPWHTHIDGSP